MDYTDEKICMYQIEFPRRAQKGDRIVVTLQAAYLVDSKFMATTSYSSNKYLNTVMEPGQTFSIKYPYRIYLSFVSTAPIEEYSDFRFTYTYMEYNPDEDDGQDENANKIVVQ